MSPQKKTIADRGSIGSRLFQRLERPTTTHVTPPLRGRIPVARPYTAGLDPDAIRAVEAALSGKDMALIGAAGTGKTSVATRILDTIAPYRDIRRVVTGPEGQLSDSSVTRASRPAVLFCDEFGIAARDPFLQRNHHQVIVTFDTLQRTSAYRSPSSGAYAFERGAVPVVLRTVYRQLSENSFIPYAEGGAIPYIGPPAMTVQGAERLRVASASPDAMSMALMTAILVHRNARANQGITQTVLIARPETRTYLERMLLAFTPVTNMRVRVIHPNEIQGLEANFIICPTAEIDDLDIVDKSRWFDVLLTRSSFRLDLILPASSKVPDKLRMSDVAMLTLSYAPSRIHDARHSAAEELEKIGTLAKIENDRILYHFRRPDPRFLNQNGNIRLVSEKAGLASGYAVPVAKGDVAVPRHHDRPLLDPLTVFSLMPPPLDK